MRGNVTYSNYSMAVSAWTFTRAAVTLARLGEGGKKEDWDPSFKKECYLHASG